jgi:hypothetical protein
MPFQSNHFIATDCEIYAVVFASSQDRKYRSKHLPGIITSFSDPDADAGVAISAAV